MVYFLFAVTVIALLTLESISPVAAVLYLIGFIGTVFFYLKNTPKSEYYLFLGERYYSDGTPVHAILREIYNTTDHRYLLIVSVPTTDEPIELEVDMAPMTAISLESAFQSAKQISEPLVISLIRFGTDKEEASYIVPANWDSELSVANTRKQVEEMCEVKWGRSPNEIALILRTASVGMLISSVVLLFINVKAALLLLVIGGSGLLLFSPNNKAKLTKPQKQGIIEKKHKQYSVHEMDDDLDHLETASSTDSCMTDYDYDTPKHKKTFAVMEIDDITAKYTQNATQKEAEPSNETIEEKPDFVNSITQSEPDLHNEAKIDESVCNADINIATTEAEPPVVDVPDKQSESEDKPKRRGRKPSSKSNKSVSGKRKTGGRKKKEPVLPDETEQMSFANVIDQSETDSHTEPDDLDKSSLDSNDAPLSLEMDNISEEVVDLNPADENMEFSFLDGPADEDDLNGGRGMEFDIPSDESSGDDTPPDAKEKVDDTNEPVIPDTGPVEVISEEDMIITGPIDKNSYRQNRYGDTLYKPRQSETPIAFEIT